MALCLHVFFWAFHSYPPSGGLRCFANCLRKKEEVEEAERGSTMARAVAVAVDWAAFFVLLVLLVAGWVWVVGTEREGRVWSFWRKEVEGETHR